MTFKLEDFIPGDIVRDVYGNVGTVRTVGQTFLYIENPEWQQSEIRRLPGQIYEIEQVMVGERRIGI
jgi:hypothetical protein